MNIRAAASSTVQLAATTSQQPILFGLKAGEVAFLGMMMTGLVTGCSGLDHWEDLTHPKIILSILLQIGGVMVAFATGRWAGVNAGTNQHKE